MLARYYRNKMFQQVPSRLPITIDAAGELKRRIAWTCQNRRFSPSAKVVESFAV